MNVVDKIKWSDGPIPTLPAFSNNQPKLPPLSEMENEDDINKLNETSEEDT